MRSKYKYLLTYIPEYKVDKQYKGLFIKVNVNCRSCKGRGYTIETWCDSKSAFEQCRIPCCVGGVECKSCAGRFNRSWRKIEKSNFKPGYYNQIPKEEIEVVRSQLEQRRRSNYGIQSRR